MTTASRPTFAPATGGQGRGETSLSSMSKQYSSRDLASHTKLKYRDIGQGSSEEVRNKDLKRDLEEREKSYKDKVDRRERERPLRSVSSTTPALKKTRVEPSGNLDADDPIEDESDDSTDDEDEDDTAELMAELQRIKGERAAEMAKKEMEQKQEEERIRMENILSGNPLLNYSGKAPKTDMRVKRRWDDDVVFKNCSRAEPERKEITFINDSLRSEFHKKFMDKYIK
uniref:EOG090X0IT3 n=1 Tax=Simocephalus serrulatus TaxID=117539 RepID=A0A4Y7NMY4_9CRUS|nr:EOG090X0IT3 [Simocephalus serrulatus]SVE94619.1 EOG090X0IT3 [Simocephalus serrulatus]